MYLFVCVYGYSLTWQQAVGAGDVQGGPCRVQRRGHLVEAFAAASQGDTPFRVWGLGFDINMITNNLSNTSSHSNSNSTNKTNNSNSNSKSTVMIK